MKHTDKEIVDALIQAGEPMWNPEGFNNDFCLFCNAEQHEETVIVAHDETCPWRMAMGNRNTCETCDGDGLIPAFSNSSESTRLVDCSDCKGTGIKS